MWLIFGTLILARMAFRPAPPAALLPTFAIFSAPPAVAGNAWFAVNGGQLDRIEIVLLGTFVLLMLVQVMMLGAYWRLPFTLRFWAFTFTAASSATYAAHWMALWGGPWTPNLGVARGRPRHAPDWQHCGTDGRRPAPGPSQHAAVGNAVTVSVRREALWVVAG